MSLEKTIHNRIAERNALLDNLRLLVKLEEGQLLDRLGNTYQYDPFDNREQIATLYDKLSTEQDVFSKKAESILRRSSAARRFSFLKKEELPQEKYTPYYAKSMASIDAA